MQYVLDTAAAAAAATTTVMGETQQLNDPIRADIIFRPCGGYNYDSTSTSIRRPFDCLSKVINVTVT